MRGGVHELHGQRGSDAVPYVVEDALPARAVDARIVELALGRPPLRKMPASARIKILALQAGMAQPGARLEGHARGEGAGGPEAARRRVGPEEQRPHLPEARAIGARPSHHREEHVGGRAGHVGKELRELPARSGLVDKAIGPPRRPRADDTLEGEDPEGKDIGPAIEVAGAFELLGDRPILGRTFRPEEDNPGSPAVVIIGNELWSSRYGSDPDILGQTIIINGVPSTVIGVMPRGFMFPTNADIWRPMATLAPVVRQTRAEQRLSVFARLADGKTEADARVELASLAAG